MTRERASAREVAVVRAGGADIPLLVALMSEFYAESSYALDPGWAAESFRALLASADAGAAWIARAGDEAIGYVVLTLRHSMEFGEAVGYVDDLFVRAQVRRGGAGSALLASLFHECRERGVAAVQVELGPDNVAAAALYRSFGFAEDALRHLTAKLR